MKQKIEIGILRYSEAQDAAVLGLTDLFQAANQLITKDRQTFQVSHWRETEGRVRRTADTRSDSSLDCLIVPPSLSPGASQTPTNSTNRWIAGRHESGAVACSVCAGAFHLAAAGLLDNRTVTTHWTLKDELARNCPSCEVDVDRMIVDDGDVITAGGVMAWTDLGLRLIDRFAGSAVMLGVARLFLIDPGGREQRYYFTFAPEQAHGDRPILTVQRWLQAHFTESVPIARMAERAGLTERTFLRRFRKATTLNPTAYVQSLRVSKARELLEGTTFPINHIAWQVGYADPAAFRRIFRSNLGINPGEYRRRFRLRSGRGRANHPIPEHRIVRPG